MSTDRLYQFDPNELAAREVKLWRQQLLNPEIFEITASALFLQAQFGVSEKVAAAMSGFHAKMWEAIKELDTDGITTQEQRKLLSDGVMSALRYHDALAAALRKNLPTHQLAATLLTSELDFSSENLAEYYRLLYSLSGALIYALQEACQIKVDAWDALRYGADEGVTTSEQRQTAQEALVLHYSTLLKILTL